MMGGFAFLLAPPPPGKKHYVVPLKGTTYVSGVSKVSGCVQIL
jgi:hypothetical protein